MSEMNEQRTPSGVPSGGQFAASARTESDVTLDEPVAPYVARSVEEDHDFYDALVMRRYLDGEAEIALAKWEAATARIRWWRPGSKKAATKASAAASTAVSTKTANDSRISAYVARHGVPDWAVQHMPKSPDTDPS